MPLVPSYTAPECRKIPFVPHKYSSFSAWLTCSSLAQSEPSNSFMTQSSISRPYNMYQDELAWEGAMLQCKEILQEEEDLSEIVQLVGKASLAETDKASGFPQSRYSPIDIYFAKLISFWWNHSKQSQMAEHWPSVHSMWIEVPYFGWHSPSNFSDDILFPSTWNSPNYQIDLEFKFKDSNWNLISNSNFKLKFSIKFLSQTTVVCPSHLIMSLWVGAGDAGGGEADKGRLPPAERLHALRPILPLLQNRGHDAQHARLLRRCQARCGNHGPVREQGEGPTSPSSTVHYSASVGHAWPMTQPRMASVQQSENGVVSHGPVREQGHNWWNCQAVLTRLKSVLR